MKLIIITGINRGLGEAFFNLLISKKDCLIVGVSRKITQVQKELLEKEKFVFIQLDLSNLKNPSIALNIESYLGNVTEVIYINNAATIHPINKIGSFKDNEIQNLMQLNTISPLLITNYLFQVASDKKMTVINISSGAADLPIVGWSLYCASKAANEMFYKTLEAQEKENENVKVVNIDPGVMNSGMQKLIRDTDEYIFPRVKDFIKLKEEHKLLSTSEVAKRIIVESNLLNDIT